MLARVAQASEPRWAGVLPSSAEARGPPAQPVRAGRALGSGWEVHHTGGMWFGGKQEAHTTQSTLWSNNCENCQYWVAKNHGETGGVAHGETAGVGDGGRLGGDGDAAGAVDVVEDAEGEGEDAARGGEFAVGGFDEDVAGGPADGADFAVEEDRAAEVL